MAASEQAVDQHYGSADISARIVEALTEAGKNIDQIQRSDLSPFDEFHGGGIASTRALASFAELHNGMQVLDIGCGIGGPARTLAAEFDCHVTGVDLTLEFVRAAEMLTARLGMDAVCTFKQGSATAVPLADSGFDCVWSQNMMMNVANKAAFFDEVVRLLKPNGIFAFEAVLEGNGEAIHLPIFWASKPEINFLVARATLESLLESAGLEPVALEETTTQVIEHGRKRKAAFATHDPANLTIHVIVPDEVDLKMDNALRNNEQGRTITIKGVYRKRP
jgi:MPBQ/MSBQ methyltransferase